MNLAADWLPVEITEKRGDVGRLRNSENEASWAVDHALNFIKENMRRAKDSITAIMPREKRGNQDFWRLQKKDTVVLNWSAWSPGMQADRVCSPVPSMQAGCQKWQWAQIDLCPWLMGGSSTWYHYVRQAGVTQLLQFKCKHETHYHLDI